MDKGMETEMVRCSCETVAKTVGMKPKGWLGPWISESENTPEILKQCGIEYVLDWCDRI